MHRSHLRVSAVLLAAGLLATACGSSPGSGTSTAAAATATANAGVTAAQQYLKTVSSNPTGIVLATPVSKKPPTGKFIIKVTTAEPVSQLISAEVGKAAAALGWKFKSVPIGPEADGMAKAFDSALQQKPDGIIVSGYPKVAYKQGLAAAKAAGVPVANESTTDPAGTGDGIVGSTDGSKQVREWGKMVAASVIVDSAGAAHVLSVNVPSYPILNEFTAGLKATFTKWCPDCVIKDLDVQATDIGTKVPNQIVSAVQADPKLTVATFSFGDLSIGVPAALKAAGLKLKITGETATPANIAGVKNGTETAWVGFAAPVLAWRDVDVIVRAITGDDPVKAGTTFLPTQMLTKDNVNGAVLNSGGYYVGVNAYEDAFKKLWLLN